MTAVKAFLENNKTLVGNLSSLALAEVVSRIGTAIFGLFMARYLAPEHFGQLSFAIAFTSFVTILADLGLTTYGVREIAQQPSKSNFLGSQILTLQLILSVLLTIGLAGVLLFVPIAPELKVLTLIMGLGIFPLSLNVAYLLQAHEKMTYVAMSKIASQLIYISIGLTLLLVFKNVYVVAISQFIASLTLAFLTFYFSRKKIGFTFELPPLASLRPLILVSVPFVLGGLLGEIYHSLDSIMLQLFKGSFEVGLYAAGYRIVALMLTVSYILFAVLFPKLSKYWVDNKQKFSQTIILMAKVFSWFYLPAAFFGAVYGSQLITLVFGSDYQEAAAPFRVLIVLPVLISFNMLLGNPLVAAGYQKQNMYSVAIGAALNLLLNFWLIPTLGTLGAAVATVAAEVTVCLYLIALYHRKIMSIVPVLRGFAGAVPPLIAVAAVVALLWALPWQLSMSVGVIGYMIIFMLTGPWKELLHAKD